MQLRKIYINYKNFLLEKKSILASLSHLNLIKYYFTIEDDDSSNGQFNATKSIKKVYI